MASPAAEVIDGATVVAAGMVSWFLHDLDAVTQTYIFLSTSKSSLAWS